jgi:hypothetical protein
MLSWSKWQKFIKFEGESAKAQMAELHFWFCFDIFCSKSGAELLAREL